MNELVRRIAITIGALLIFRLGSHIPIVLTGISARSRLLSSGAIDRVSILPLTPVPYASATILSNWCLLWGRLSALERSGGRTIQDVEPGEATADYLDRVLSLTMVLGAVYLVVVSLIPEALVAGGVTLPYKIGGGSVLIVVCTILDLKKQVRALSLTNPGGVRQ